jgi:hypothetical protein
MSYAVLDKRYIAITAGSDIFSLRCRKTCRLNVKTSNFEELV